MRNERLDRRGAARGQVILQQTPNDKTARGKIPTGSFIQKFAAYEIVLDELRSSNHKLPRGILMRTAVCLQKATAQFVIPDDTQGNTLVTVGVRNSVAIAVAVGVSVEAGIGVAVGGFSGRAGPGVLVGVKVGSNVVVGVGVLPGEIAGAPEETGVALMRYNPSRSLPVRPQALPSKNSVESKLQAVTSPKEVGVQVKISSSPPATPFTEKGPLVEI
jgi:hypothetical protein